MTKKTTAKRATAIRLFEYSVNILRSVVNELRSIRSDHETEPYSGDLRGIVRCLEDMEMSLKDLANRTRREMEAI